MRARVRGVITWASHWSCVLQDSSGGIFIWYSAKEWERQPRPEELWEIEGVTDAGDFSPLLTAASGTYLGNTVLPEPAQPTWEQLMNGSMDAASRKASRTDATRPPPAAREDAASWPDGGGG